MKLTRIIYLLFFLLICQLNIVLAQKKKIDSSAYTEWSSLEQPFITNDGKYVHYVIENEPVGGQTLILQSTESKWKKSFKGINSQLPLISKGGNYAVFLNQNDSLVIVTLGRDLIKYIPNVNVFSMCRNEVSEWVTYQLKESHRELIVQNLSTGKKFTYSSVINKIIGDDGQTIVLQRERKVDGQILQELNWIDLNTGKNTLIWKGLRVQRIALDTKHHQLAFSSEKELFLYNIVNNKLSCLINNQTDSLDSGLSFGGIKQFSRDGDRLFIELKEEDKQKPKPGLVEVWSYLDTKIQTQQENEIGARTYAAVVNLMDGKIIRLEQEFEHLEFNSFDDVSSDTIRILYHEGKGRDGAGFGDIRYLISLKNGKRIPLKYSPERLSPNGKYLVYLDPERHVYISYNTKTKVSHTISKAFSESNVKTDLERHGIAGWLENDEGVLFYDNYDLWRMDLSGMNAPVNLTAGYGKANNLVFSIVYGQSYSHPLQKTQKIVLAAFNLKSKQNGFYSFKLDKVNKPELLSMGNYIYYAQDGVVMDADNSRGIIPVKAKKSEVYVVSRISANEVPNYFSTRDFKTFRALSNVHPQLEYNWYTTELRTWTSLDGKTLQGILYKPENFDPSKKYPVIFNYYEGKSNSLNAYIKPEALCNGCVINIPTYISNGYLVFIPDIVYKIGDPMQGTYDAVVSAAKYIGSLPYVDPKRMGIQGCSWGGIQTNYLVTHTNLFAAACSASGIADWISHYGKLFSNGIPINGMYEVGQLRMGKSIWEIPDAYVKNSPVFQLDKVNTPLLIMHTKKDGVCPYEDAIELFTGLRRLGKKSWMLAYSEGDHGVFGKEAEDFSTRMMQFFDHYLKDKPAPVWMTRGIAAEKRGFENGLAYDTKIKTPGPGLLTPKEQKTVDSLMTRKPILIELK